MKRIHIRDLDPIYVAEYELSIDNNHITIHQGESRGITIELSSDLEITFESFRRDEHNQSVRSSRLKQLQYLLYMDSIQTVQSAEAEFLAKVDSEQLICALKSLSPKQERRIRTFFFDELSYSRIAALEGCSRQAIKKSIRIGLHKLKIFLGTSTLFRTKS